MQQLAAVPDETVSIVPRVQRCLVENGSAGTCKGAKLLKYIVYKQTTDSTLRDVMSIRVTGRNIFMTVSTSELWLELKLLRLTREKNLCCFSLEDDPVKCNYSVLLNDSVSVHPLWVNSVIIALDREKMVLIAIVVLTTHSMGKSKTK